MSLPPNAVAGAMARHGAVAPILLLDVLDVNGFSYHWASAPVPSAAALGCGPLLTGQTPDWNAHLGISDWDDTYLAWLISAGPFHESRSMQADTGNFVIQNISGDTLQRSMNKLITGTAFEGALFVYREWNVDAGAVEYEFHGRLSIVGVTETDAEFSAEQLFNPSEYQACDLFAETCRWRYGSAACGDTANNPCQQTFLTCRQPARFGGIINVLIDIPTDSATSVSGRDVVRRRQV